MVEFYLIELYIGFLGGGFGFGVGDWFFDIDVEGVIENGIDLFVEYGLLVVVIKIFNVIVMDGILNIDIDVFVDNGKLNGFCIIFIVDFVVNIVLIVDIFV